MAELTADITDFGIGFKDETDIDIWGCAIAWYGTQIGAEYNYCMDNGESSCAIYSMHYNGDPNDPETRIETDTSDFEHYDIEWDKPDWEQRLLDRMKVFVLQRI